MDKTNTWLMPNYYKKFKCKCGDCRHTCCHGWQIGLTKAEYTKLISLDLDEDLRHRMDISFKAPDFIDENKYRIISFNYLGDCPMQKDGLCSIHQYAGEENLPLVCRLYPRSLKRVNNTSIACLSSSCERVVEMLLDDEGISLYEDELDAKPVLEYNVDINLIEDIKKYEKIINSEDNLAKAIKLICLEVNKTLFIKDYNLDLNPLNEALNILNRLKGQNFLADIVDEIFRRYKDNQYQYELDKEDFEKRFPNWQHYFKNVINNSLLYENFPFVDKRFDKTLAYKGLCASFGLLRVVTIGYTSIHSTKEDLVDAISALFHLIDHTAFYYNINVLSKASALLLKL